MSEEEIINVITKMLEKNDDIFEETGNHLYFSKMTAEAIQGLLDLYNKEKLNSFNLSEQLNKEKEKNKEAIKWIEKVMNNGKVAGCNLADLQFLLDILKGE